jgi:hypothetical protein
MPRNARAVRRREALRTHLHTDFLDFNHLKLLLTIY